MPRQGASQADPIDIAVGVDIRIQRRSLNITQAELAKAIGVPFQQVQKYEKGVNRISASMLVGCAACLETTVAALVGEAAGASSAAVLSDALANLTFPGALDLLQAYSAIADPDARRGLVTVAAKLGRTPPMDQAA